MTTARARGLGAEVRQLRKGAGLRLEELAQRCDWSRATLGRIEAGTKVPTETEIAIVLATLGIRGKERSRLLELARDAHEQQWWEASYSGLPQQLMSLMEFERTAVRITDVSLALVPGLLQTADYTRAIIKIGGVSDSVLEARVALRLGRQGILTRSAPVTFNAILDESVLHRPIGGPQAMAEQLRHIVRLARRSNVTVRVLPLSVGAHVLLNGSMFILEFKRQRPIVFLEHRRSGAFVDALEDTSLYIAEMRNLVNMALSATESVELIAAQAEAMEDQYGKVHELA